MTDHISSEKLGLTSDRARLRELLVNQYALHEARHRGNSSGLDVGGNWTVPKAHAPADIYKCLHQGIFGVGHIIQDETSFGRFLTRDLMAAEPNVDEPLLENVSLRGSVFRVNFRPYRKRLMGEESRAAALLLDVCLQSAEMPQGRPDDFLAVLAGFKSLNDRGELSVSGVVYAFPPALLAQFLTEVKDFVVRTASIPVLSHSEQYRSHNAPSYRVVNRQALENSDLAFLLREGKWI